MKNNRWIECTCPYFRIVIAQKSIIRYINKIYIFNLQTVSYRLKKKRSRYDNLLMRWRPLLLKPIKNLRIEIFKFWKLYHAQERCIYHWLNFCQNRMILSTIFSGLKSWSEKKILKILVFLFVFAIKSLLEYLR